jgi:uncharacterized protein (TIGR03083 family)
MTKIDDSLPRLTRRSPLTHDEWMSAAELEYQRLLEMFVDLTGEDWQRPTDCDEWDVRQVLAHLVGGAESTASMRELWRLRRLGRMFRPGVDGMNDVEVHERADTPPARLLTDLAAAAVRGVRARRRIPAVVRVLRVPFGPPLGVRSIGYLMDRIYTRDAWMHRIDITRAASRPMLLTPEHDGRLVDDIVQEWAHDHRRPYLLTLTGPAGGHWSTGTDAEPLTLDAIQFSRIMAGRAAGDGLLNAQVPF